MRNFFLVLIALLLIPSCKKSSSNAHAQPQKVAPKATPWLEAPISEEERLELEGSFLEFNNNLIEAYKFQFASQKDFVSAIENFGTKHVQEQLKETGLSEQAMHVIQRSFQHMPICRSNLSGDNYVLAYYSPITDFLLLTQWNKDNKITALSFQTGNSFLGIGSIVPGHGIDGKIHVGIFNRSVEAYRRVARKIYKNYGFAHRKENQQLPKSVITPQLEIAIVGAFHAKTQWQKEVFDTPAGNSGIEQWLGALNSETPSKMSKLLDSRSPFTAEGIFQLPKELRNGSLVIFATLYANNEELRSEILTVNPKFPHYWFGFFITNEGKFLVNGSYPINSIDP